VATLLFIGFWVLLGLTVVYVASRGGPRKARAALYGGNRKAARVATAFFTLAYIGLGIAVPVLIISGDRESTAVAGTGITLTKNQETGRGLFGDECNQCHTLKAAETVGKVGPDLDRLVGGIPSAKGRYDLVLSAILNGRQQGNGTMPAGLLQGKDAQDVASFVAAVAGK
jgi:mono/diheme cytochrome c family protein